MPKGIWNCPRPAAATGCGLGASPLRSAAPPPMRSPERPFIEREIATVSQYPASISAIDCATSCPMLLPPPRMSTPMLVRIPSAEATSALPQESPAVAWWLASPSISSTAMPASAAAVTIASQAIESVVRPDQREYSVSPTPTMQ